MSIFAHRSVNDDIDGRGRLWLYESSSFYDLRAAIKSTLAVVNYVLMMMTFRVADAAASSPFKSSSIMRFDNNLCS